MKSYQCSQGRILILDSLIKGCKFYLINIYSPNQESILEQFYISLDVLIQDSDLDNLQPIITGGDWNTCLSSLDKHGGMQKLKVNVIKNIYLLKDKYDLVDIWRIRNLNTKKFTWKQKRPLMVCRLDYFFISGVLEDYVVQTNIIPATYTDHSSIELKFKKIQISEARGKGYWKFNVSLLLDSSYRTMLKEKIIQWKTEIATEVEDHRVRWELNNFYIKQETIKYCKKVQSHKRCLYKELQDKLISLDSQPDKIEEYFAEIL